ncbi:MAG: TIR domain-containing protein [Burkholderiales bacterium]|nr:TIR domain-containing protein [Burkholderiales bacterium]
MKLFISWSGDVSQQIAQEIRKWVPLILPAVKPFITSSDIEKGGRWGAEIPRELEESNFGLVCLTPTNLSAPWILFEAGALSKQLSGRVATCLFGVEPTSIRMPLSMFQWTKFEEEDVRKLIVDINKNVEPDQIRPTSELDELFPVLWPKLRDPISLILEAAAHQGEDPPAPPVDFAAVADEILTLVRRQNALLTDSETLLKPVLDALKESIDKGRRPLFVYNTPPGRVIDVVVAEQVKASDKSTTEVVRSDPNQDASDR